MAKQWKKTPGVITRLVENDKSADLAYEYQFLGSVFQGDNLAFLQRGSIVEKSHALSEYEVGMPVEVFVNPDSPEEIGARTANLPS